MMQSFSYYQPTKIHFAQGAIQQAVQQIARYGQRCLVVSTPIINSMQHNYHTLFTGLKQQGVDVIHFDGVMPNPSTQVIDAGQKLSRQHHCDVVLAFGGGSSIDSGKIIAAMHHTDQPDWSFWFEHYQSAFTFNQSLPEKPLPLIAIPTTSGTGSHVTHAAVITNETRQEKLTLFHPEFFPREAFIDPELMISLPPRMTAMTGFDAFSHAFESFTGARPSPFIDNMALQAMRLIIQYLPGVVKQGHDIIGRTQLAIADTLAGIALTNGGAGAPHPIGEIIGGQKNITHGLTLAIVFPAYIRLQWKKQPERFAQVAELFGATGNTEQKAAALETLLVNFLQKIGLETHLTQAGLSQKDVDELVPLLNFNLPLTSSEEMQQILRDSL